MATEALPPLSSSYTISKPSDVANYLGKHVSVFRQFQQFFCSTNACSLTDVVHSRYLSSTHSISSLKFSFHNGFRNCLLLPSQYVNQISNFLTFNVGYKLAFCSCSSENLLIRNSSCPRHFTILRKVHISKA